MSKKLYEESSISGIASAIREKLGVTNTYKVSEMRNAILSIETGGSGLPEGMAIGATGASDTQTGVLCLLKNKCVLDFLKIIFHLKCLF